MYTVIYSYIVISCCYCEDYVCTDNLFIGHCWLFALGRSADYILTYLCTYIYLMSSPDQYNLDVFKTRVKRVFLARHAPSSTALSLNIR